jgi:hypothetical protein
MRGPLLAADRAARAVIRGQAPAEVSYSAATAGNTAVARVVQVIRAKPARRTSNSETVSQKPALETGADFRVDSPHSVNGDRYRTPRKARNGAVCASTRLSEWETDCVAEDAVIYEPVSAPNSQINGNLMGIAGVWPRWPPFQADDQAAESNAWS